MRIFLAGAAAAAFAFAATPAFAQYGGSPEDQIDGAPSEPDVAAPQGDPGEPLGKPGVSADGETYAAADIDADPDLDPYDDPDYEAVDPEAGENAPVEGETWQGEDGRTYCRRSDGTTGLIVGGGAGALVGRGIDGGRRRGTGTIIGGIIGALVGSAIERSANEQTCR